MMSFARLAGAKHRVNRLHRFGEASPFVNLPMVMEMICARLHTGDFIVICFSGTEPFGTTHRETKHASNYLHHSRSDHP
jgi:hypothetical protein